MKFKKSITWALCLLLASCATPRYGSKIEIVGSNYESADKINEKVNDVPQSVAKKVKVFFGELPPGFEMENGKLKVIAGSKHKIIGEVKTTGPVAGLFAKPSNYNDDEGFRKAYCPVAYNLMWIPPFLFSLTPFPWFCPYGYSSNDPEDISMRKRRLIESLQRVVSEAKGNAVIVTELGKTEYFQANTSAKIGETEMTSASGWAVLLQK